ncbi:MAG TPA: hypothetical protein V6D28_22950 [Leptolyngbyaceae cyanobacterium]
MSTANDLLDLNYANAQLDAAEQARLTELETVIEQGLQTFYEVGKALDEIREKRLYRETHKTFDAYCKEKWGIARQRAYRLIQAAQVRENLSPIGDILPTKENQIRSLSNLPPALQLEIWQEAVESAPNGIPTGAAVQRLVERRVSSRSTRRNSADTSSEVEQLRQENQQLKERLRQQNLERKQRAAEVAAELERLREENRQLKAELRQRDIDWEKRLAYEREKIREEVKAEYEGQINALTTQVSTLTQQLQEMTAKYEAVMARLEAIEGKR